jgi:hypothetical protein
MAFLKLFATWAVASLVALAAPTPSYPNPWESHHALTADQYQSTYDNLVGQGYRLNYVSGYTVNDDPRYAAVWEKKPESEAVEWIARHGLTSDDYQSYYDNYNQQGYRIVLINGYTVRGEDRYVAIWDKSTSGPWVARHRLTADEYQTTYDSLKEQGYKLRHISSYTIGSEARYAAIWEQTDETYDWVARHGLTADQYRQEYDTYTSQGYRLVVVSGYGIDSVDYYTALWEKRDSLPWVSRYGLTATEYQTASDNYTSQGYIPRVINGYTVAYEDRYAAIWEQYSAPY